MFLGPSDWTPLHRAVWNQNSTEVESLVRQGGLNVADLQGWTPLHLACAAESGMLFDSHQISRRGYSQYSFGSGKKRYESREWGPNHVTSHSNDNERVASMRVLKILLEHGANVHGRALGFCTPLHCAANSGWFSHALALVKAGAKVYTGPECSPLCWVKDGSGGSHLVARYLRAELGDQGLTMIEQDHVRDTGISFKGVLPRDEEVFFKTQTNLMIDNNGLCSVCSEMTLESFLLPRGFKHLSSFEDVRRSAIRCKFCHIIVSTLAEGRPQSGEAGGQVLISASPETDRPLNTLQIKRSEGCSCDSNIPYPSPDFSKCRGTCNILQTAEVVIFTKQDMSGCAIDIQQGFDLGESPESADTLDFMKRCLVECDMNHPGCKSQDLNGVSSSEHTPLPSRLIEVRKDARMDVRIVNAFGKSGRYAAFSHRWVSGPMPQWVTRQDTLKQRHSWFPANSLPASLMDAIKITRQLGLDYVWIDSICIIQDSSEDWNNEAANMASVYANAYVTIFADNAKDDDHGFLGPRQVFPSTSIAIQGNNNALVTVQIRKSSPSAWKHRGASLFASDTREFSHLSKRAWILQERILSRRKLHFGAHQVYWMCREHVLTEDGGIPHNWHIQAEIDIHNMMKSPQKTDRALESNWGALVKMYSSLQLTHTEDKLPALSGLASVFWKMSQHDYIAGIWKQSFATGLAWYVTVIDPDKKSLRPAKYRAPSFSWACLDDQVAMKNFDDDDSSPSSTPDTVDVALVSSGDIILEGVDPFGKLRSAKIVLSGLIRKGITIGPFLTTLGDTGKGYNPVYNLEMAPIGSMLNDAKDDIPHGEVTCLKLFGGLTDVFLVLLPTDLGVENCTTFRRVGLGSTMLWGRSRYGDEKFFDGAERKIITIV